MCWSSFLWYTLVWIWECHQWNCVEVHFSGTPLCGFERVTNETVLKFMKQMSPKTFVPDPIPTSLLFECSNEIVPQLPAIVNQSLSTGIFPSCIKAAIVKPFLKKTSLHPNVLKTTTTLGLFQTYPLCPKLLRKLFLINFFVILIKKSLAYLPVSFSPKTQY